ncbi:MAG: DUF3473 domain-containing protein [Candidatus Omnitrophica bacterium]|nr:DUF3473 domain-containing protein [Candidatus Omnitrophota bacterium]
MTPDLKNVDKLITTGSVDQRADALQKGKPATITNVMSIDLEEWFQVTNFEKVINRSDWERYPLRASNVMSILLDIFAEHNVRATFFTLGWVAQRYPKLIRRIHQAGHEIASHGYDHRLVTTMTPSEFRAQLLQSKDILEQILSSAVNGYRAPSYSFCNDTYWVVDELLEAGFLFDSSIFPFGPRRHPKLCVSRFPCLLPGKKGDLAEYPLSTLDWGGLNVPIAGGGYFRLLPYNIIWMGIRRLNYQRKAAIMYFHPWEFDPGQPRVTQASWLSKFRHYNNLDVNLSKFQRLIKDFRFASFKNVFWNKEKGKYDIQSQI